MSDLPLDVKPKSKITSEEMQRLREDLRQADAHNRIAGLYPSPRGSAIFEAFVRGDIDYEEILPLLHALHRQP
jgi:hypothetical protein